MKILTKKINDLERRVEAILEWPMVFLVLLLIPLMAIPAIYTLSPIWEKIFFWTDIVIWAALYFELFIKLLVSKNYLNTFKKNWFLVIILLLPAFRIFRLVRLVRMLRVIRLLRLQSLVGRLKRNTQILIHNLEYVLVIFLSTILIASFFMWQVEQSANGAIQSFEDALWWSVITITTIGYGDVVPTTSAGKIIGAIFAIIGVLIFMTMTAKIASIFIRNKIEVSQEKLLKRLIEQVEKSKNKER